MIESPPPGVRQTRHRIDGIDLLRGLSIVFVLMNHVNMRLLAAKVAYTEGLPAQLIYTLVWNGQFAVQIFFVISGYLLLLRAFTAGKSRKLCASRASTYYDLLESHLS